MYNYVTMSNMEAKHSMLKTWYSINTFSCSKYCTTNAIWQILQLKTNKYHTVFVYWAVNRTVSLDVDYNPAPLPLPTEQYHWMYTTNAAPLPLPTGQYCWM